MSSNVAAFWTAPINRSPVRGSLSPRSSSSESDDDIQVIAEVRKPIHRPRHARRMRAESSDDDDYLPVPVRPLCKGVPAKRISMNQRPATTFFCADSSSDSDLDSIWDSEDDADLDPSVEVNIQKFSQLSFPNMKDDSVDLSTKTPLPTNDLDLAQRPTSVKKMPPMEKPVRIVAPKAPRKTKKTSPPTPVAPAPGAFDPRALAVPVVVRSRPEVCLKKRTTSDVVSELVAKKRKL